MSRVAVLRPEPGNAQTAARVRALGHQALAMPLFAVAPIAWTLPPGEHDALMLTSANAVRHGGAGLTALRRLPVLAVGEATAAAARAAGFAVTATGTGDAATLLADAPHRRILHLGGRDRVPLADRRVAAVAVYGSDPLPAIDPASLAGGVALLHSARAATRLAELVAAAARPRIRLAALSPAILAAAGSGWGGAQAAARPREDALLGLLDRRPD